VLANELLRDDLVEEVGRGPSTGGKQPILLRVRPDGRHAIGLDLGDSSFSAALVDLRGNVIQSARVGLEGRNGRAALEAVYGLIENVERRNGASSLLGIGIGAPGLVDSRTGTVRWAVNLNWEDLPLGQLVTERFGVPVIVANDSQAAAVAETTFGRAGWAPNLIVVRVGRGIGAGIILDGALFQGDGSGAGEIGHSIFGPWLADGAPERCRCGRRGCLETIASVPAMVRAAKRLDDSIVDDRSLIDAFCAGNPNARKVVLRAGGMVGEGIAALIAALNVNHILLIGPATQLGQDWLDAIRRRAEECALPLLARDTRIELGTARDDDVVIGASAMLMTRELGLGLVR
jgi:N-acetylglucosamine repressor